jgi:hypothetical protein
MGDYGGIIFSSLLNLPSGLVVMGHHDRRVRYIIQNLSATIILDTIIHKLPSITWYMYGAKPEYDFLVNMLKGVQLLA